MNFRQQQFRQAVQYQQHLDTAKTQSTLVKAQPTSEPVASTPEPVAEVIEPAPVIVETPIVETPIEPETEPEIPSIPENRFESIFPRI
jgi:hypothetical protein